MHVILWGWGEVPRVEGGHLECGEKGVICRREVGNVLGWGAYHALHVADEHAVVEEGARFIAVADVVEGFGAVLAGEVEEDFLTTAVGMVSLLVLRFNLGLVKERERSEDNRLRWPCFVFFGFPSSILALVLSLRVFGF